MRKRLMMLCALLMVFAVVSAGMTMAWFTDDASGGEAVFTAGTVEIAAGQTCLAECPFDQGECIPYELLPVTASGIRGELLGTPPSGRDDPANVLELDETFFSLGFGGEVVAEFDYGVCPDSIVIIVEDTWVADYPTESAIVEVSCNGDDWTVLGEIDNQGSTEDQRTIIVDIPEEFSCCIKYVKLTDSSDKSDFTGENADGFDVNVIKLEGCICGDANWNPGDCTPRAFRVCNKGTKDILLRAKVTKAWYWYDEGTFTWEVWNDPPLVGPLLGPKDEEAVLFECVDPCDGFSPYVDDWTYEDGYYYYVGEYDTGSEVGVIPGTFDGLGKFLDPACIEMCLPVYFNHLVEEEYMGKRFVLGIEFEAVQASNHAPFHEWETDIFGVPEGCISGPEN